MSQLTILISHAFDERGLADAWKKLIESTSLGMIEVWYSSDSEPSGGVELGRVWRDDLYQRLGASQFILAIQTPTSLSRPWIMWECGVASGIDKERGIIPIVYAMGRGDLANPLNSYQAYQGDDEWQVREVCKRLASAAHLTIQEFIYDEPLKAYRAAINLYHPRKAIRTEQMLLWRGRFEELLSTGRVSELYAMRQQMYASLGTSFQPVEPAIHDFLSKALLEQRQYAATIEEADYALSFLSDDVHLLHRKALAQVHLHNLEEGNKLIGRILALNGALSLNAEIAALQGRIYREQWRLTQDPRELDAAIEAYARAYQADTTSYYTGINAAALAFAKGDTESGTQILHEVLLTCQQLRQQRLVSYWVDFTMGEAYLALGEIEQARAAYQQGLSRNLSPSPRDRQSALEGVRRMAEAKKLSTAIVAPIMNLLDTRV